MRRLSAFVFIGLFALLPLQAVESAPSFPVDLEVEYCLGDFCSDMVVTLEEDGEFFDSDRDFGIWYYRPSESSLLIRYEGDDGGIDFFGFRSGRCFSGTTLIDEVESGEWSGCAR